MFVCLSVFISAIDRLDTGAIDLPEILFVDDIGALVSKQHACLAMMNGGP